MNTYPLISCLCVTYKRPEVLARAIQCFQGQRYPNKELVIVYLDDDVSTKELLHRYEEKNLVFIEIESSLELSLGAKRNISIDRCNGEYICLWDDDDWYHELRIETQYLEMKRHAKNASILTNLILYDATTNRSYMSFNWVWEGTLLCKKDKLRDYQYLDKNKGEDTQLIANILDEIYPVVNPTLYIYIYTGGNTGNHSHFRAFFLKSQKLSEDFSSCIKMVLECSYSHEEGSRLLSAEALLAEVRYMDWVKGPIEKILN